MHLSNRDLYSEFSAKEMLSKSFIYVVSLYFAMYFAENFIMNLLHIVGYLWINYFLQVNCNYLQKLYAKNVGVILPNFHCEFR